MKKNIDCFCGACFQFEYDEEINIDDNPEYLEEILNGTFMSSVCASCGKNHKPEFNIKIIWNAKNLTLNVIPELERGSYYRQTKDPDKKKGKTSSETIIGYPYMADRIAVYKDNLEPAVIEALKSFLLAKAEENYPDKDINAWYRSSSPLEIEFHLDGIKHGETAVLKIPKETYDKTLKDYKKHPGKEIYSSLRVRSYLSVQNILQPRYFS